MAIIHEYGYLLLVLGCVFGFIMAYGVGANDVSNAMGTSVGSGALTVNQAIIIAIIFEFAGAYLAGGSVSATIRKGIVDPNLPVFIQNPDLLVFGMLAALLSAGSWLLIASYFGWPVSTTHSIVGAIVGFAWVGISFDVVNWWVVGSIAMSWILSPLLSGVLAFFIFISIQYLILNTSDPFTNAKRYAPMYMFIVGFMIAMVTLSKGLKHLGLVLNHLHAFILACGLGVTVAVIGKVVVGQIQEDLTADKKFSYSSVEKIFGVLMVFTACSMAFAHGSNDVANAVGPLASIVSVIKSGGVILKSVTVPSWVLLVGAMGIVAGLVTYGYRVMATIGQHITELTPSRGFAAELAAATTVVLATGTGMPISTTHTLVGAVLGVGLARGIAALNIRVIGTIFMSWVATLPAGALLAIIFFNIINFIFAHL